MLILGHSDFPGSSGVAAGTAHFPKRTRFWSLFPHHSLVPTLFLSIAHLTLQPPQFLNSLDLIHAQTSQFPFKSLPPDFHPLNPPPSCCISADKQQRSLSNYQKKNKHIPAVPKNYGLPATQLWWNSQSTRAKLQVCVTHSKRQNMLWGDWASEKAVLTMKSVFQADYEQLLQSNLPKSTGMQLHTFSSGLSAQNKAQQAWTYTFLLTG